MPKTEQEWGVMVLRCGLGAMFLWFGISQLTDVVNWVGWVPAWAPALLHTTPEMIVYLNGTFEIIGGGLLVLGLFIRPIAILLGLHLALIAYEIGLNDIGVRDWGLAAATSALALMGQGGAKDLSLAQR